LKKDCFAKEELTLIEKATFYGNFLGKSR